VVPAPDGSTLHLDPAKEAETFFDTRPDDHIPPDFNPDQLGPLLRENRQAVALATGQDQRENDFHLGLPATSGGFD